MRIALVAGEASGDQLGAGLINQLKEFFPNASYYGIGGPLMQKTGFETLYKMDDISMIGLEGVFTKLPMIIGVRRNLANRFIKDKPDVFIGIDVPDFNLGLEKKLTQNSITCIHYVSPTIWAWRGHRIKTIKKSIAHMLVLFPFETQIYNQYNVPATFVGHPIADEVDAVANQHTCRTKFQISGSADVIALLPGSRTSEIEKHTELFLLTAQSISKSNQDVKFIISAINQKAEEFISHLIAEKFSELQVDIVTGNVREVISASDLVLAASGTVTLETALMGKPLVVAYKVSKLSELMVKCFSKVDFFAMPNILLEKPEVPEFIQKEATVENLSGALMRYLNDVKFKNYITNKFKGIKSKLKVNANINSAKIVRSYLETSK